MYLELFASVVSRLRDQTVYVRKLALKLLQQLVYMFSIFYDIKAAQNEQFPSKEQVLNEFESAEQMLKEMQKSYDEIQGLFNEETMSLIEKNPDLEPEELLQNSQNLTSLNLKSDSIKR